MAERGEKGRSSRSCDGGARYARSSTADGGGATRATAPRQAISDFFETGRFAGDTASPEQGLRCDQRRQDNWLALAPSFLRRADRPGWQRFYVFVPIMVCYLVPSLMTTFGLIDVSESNRAVAKDYFLPAALFLMTLSIDIKGILGLGSKAIVMFLTATVGIVMAARWLVDRGAVRTVDHRFGRHRRMAQRRRWRKLDQGAPTRLPCSRSMGIRRGLRRAAGGGHHRSRNLAIFLLMARSA